MDPWTIVLWLACLQGVFLSALVGVPRSRRRLPRTFLALLILVLSIHLGESAAFRMGFTALDERGSYIFFTTPITYLFGPLFYLFARTLLHEGKGPVWPHLIPAALAGVNSLPAYIGVVSGAIPVPNGQPSGPSMFFWINPYVSWGLFIAQASLYFALSYRLLRTFSRNLRESESCSNALDADWLWKIAVVMIVNLVAQLGSLISMLNFGSHSIEIECVLSMSLALTVHFVGWITLSRTEVIVVPLAEPAPVVVGVSAAASLDSDTDGKYQRSGLDLDRQRSGRTRVLAYMDEARPWLDPNLRLRDLADAVGLTSHHLSQVLNQEIGSTFFDFVNEYRVEEAKRRLANPEAKHLTHLAIALEAGFASKSSFHRVFKNRVGKTPSDYVRSLGETAAVEARDTA